MTGFETMIVPAGYTRTVPYQERRGAALGRSGHAVLNPNGVSAWRDPAADVWRQHGVWDVDRRGEPVLLRDTYFADVDFATDGLRPFLTHFAAAVRGVDPGAILFVEARPNHDDAILSEVAEPLVYAEHWYDSLTTRRKHYDPAQALNPETGELLTGETAVRQAYWAQLGLLVDRARRDGLVGPVLIGEFGLPFDLDRGAAYVTGDYAMHEAALTAYYDALDAHLLHATLWNYTPDNTNQWGDGWNGEDLSIFSRDQQENPADPDSGARALRGFCRPSVQRCAGQPVSQRFDAATGAYELVIDADPRHSPTQIFVPAVHYPDGGQWEVSDGQAAFGSDDRLLDWACTHTGPQWLRLWPSHARPRPWPDKE
jgi:hypothetical protein